MARKKLVATTAVLGVVVLGGAVLAFGRGGTGRVTLTYDPEECVLASPDEPKVFQKRLKNIGRDKRARWDVVASQKNQYYWKIEYQASSNSAPEKQGTGDYLTPDGGIEPIACTGPQHTQSGKAPKMPEEDLDWPYKVTVFQCDGETELCVEDPIIWIKK